MLFLPLLGTTSTWATIESIKDSPSSHFTYGPSDASTSGYTDNMVSKAPGFSNQNFFIYDDSLTHWSGTNITVYSTLIEEDNGAFWGGDNNGNLYCGEKESGILKSAMTAFGTDSPEMIKSLVCAGNSTGIYTITKTKIGTNQSDSNCSENYDLLMDYISRPENNPAYQITVTPSGDAVGHYSNWFRDNVGDFSSLNDQQNKASDYAKAATYFQNYCVEDGPSENSFSSTNEVQVWDTFSGKGSAEKAVYYKFKSQPSKPMLLNIDSDATSSCEDVAAMLTEEGAKAYAAESSISGETLDSGTVTGTADEVSGEEQADCYNSGGAKSLGWIMCPIMELMTDATEYLYNNVVEPGLRVQPILFAKGDSPTKTHHCRYPCQSLLFPLPSLC